MENILIVDDDIAISESLRFALNDKYNLFLSHNSKDAMEYFLKEDIAVTILDLKLGNENGMDIYKRIKEINKEAIVIIITGYGTIKSSIEAIKSGVFYYLTKPIDLKELEILIEKGIEINNLYKKISLLDKKSKDRYQEYGIIAKSESMKKILSIAQKVKDIDSNILIKEDILLHLNKNTMDKVYINKKLIPIFVGESFEDIERKVIEQTYKECDYNQKETAEILGITDRTIRNKLKKYKKQDQIE